jgi:hypothetical protein
MVARVYGNDGNELKIKSSWWYECKHIKQYGGYMLKSSWGDLVNSSFSSTMYLLPCNFLKKFVIFCPQKKELVGDVFNKLTIK